MTSSSSSSSPSLPPVDQDNDHDHDHDHLSKKEKKAKPTKKHKWVEIDDDEHADHDIKDDLFGDIVIPSASIRSSSIADNGIAKCPKFNGIVEPEFSRIRLTDRNNPEFKIAVCLSHTLIIAMIDAAELDVDDLNRLEGIFKSKLQKLKYKTDHSD